MQLAAKHDVAVAPFFVVWVDDGESKIFKSALQLIKECLSPETKETDFSFQAATTALARAEPLEIGASQGVG